MSIRIECMYDYNDCDQAGCSGGEEYGGRIFIDDELVFEHIPHAGCYDNARYDELWLLQHALGLLGHEVSVLYVDSDDMGD